MNSHVLEKVKEKSRRYKKYRSTQDGVDYLAYARIRNQARWECRKAKKEFERSLAKEAKSNSSSSSIIYSQQSFMIITGRRMSCTDNDTRHIHRGLDLHNI